MKFYLLMMSILMLSIFGFSQSEIIEIKSKDFEIIEVDGYVPYYVDKQEKLAINAKQYKSKVAAAITKFSDEDGVYNIEIVTVCENDGESSYQLFIDDKLIGEYQNPESENGKLAGTIWKDVKLSKGASIKVTSNSHSNGKIPEKGGFAFARGRWLALKLEKQ